MTAEHNNLNIKPEGIPKWLVALVDISLANLGLYIGFVVATGQLESFQIGPLFILFPAVSLVTVVLFNSLGLYASQRSGFTPIVRALVIGVIGLTLFSIFFAFWTRAFIFQRSVFVAAPMLQLVMLLGWRILYWRLELWIHGQKKLLVIGSPEGADHALEKIMCLPRGIFEVTRVLNPGKIDELTEWLDRADAVLITGDLAMDQKNKIVRESFDRNKEVFIVPDLYEIILTRAAMTQVHDTPVIECHDMQLTFLQRLAKRSLDLACVLVVAAPAALLLLVTGLAVRFTSPGPVIFAQERVGYRGRTFTLYKLRTMVADAEEESGPIFSTEEDDRVTPVGRFLRSTRLDELPQLYNVLRGDISLVGPRPERPFFVEQFQEVLPEYKLRHLVKPGITGLAQVNGYYATDSQDKLRYDLYYLSDYSILLDFKILMLTIPTLFNREAAKGVSKDTVSRKA